MECAVLFSGGSDSTLAAALAAERFTRVHLLTMNRRGYFRAEAETEQNFQNLARIYGEKKFVRKMLDIESLHREVCESGVDQLKKKFGLSRVCLVFSKIALHGAALEYCKRNNIQNVCDGAVPYMYLYPDQNRTLGLKQYGRFYSRFGVKYEQPVFSVSQQVEQLLFLRGITATPFVRGTSGDRQVFYVEQILFALFLRFSIAKLGYREHRKKLRELYSNRLDFLYAKFQ